MVINLILKTGHNVLLKWSEYNVHAKAIQLGLKFGDKIKGLK